MTEKPCPVCETPMHPTMERDYGGCSVDHGEIADLRTEVARLRAGLQEVVDRERVWDALDIRHHVTAILST